jgi:hypothetical protein
MHLALATRFAPIEGFLRARPTLAGARVLLAIGLPISLRQSMLCACATSNYTVAA